MTISIGGDVRPTQDVSGFHVTPGYWPANHPQEAIAYNFVADSEYDPDGTSPDNEGNNAKIWFAYEWPVNLDIGHSAAGSFSLTNAPLRVQNITLGVSAGSIGRLSHTGAGPLNTAVRVIETQHILLWNEGASVTNPNASTINFPPATYDPPDPDDGGPLLPPPDYSIRRSGDGKLIVGKAGTGLATLGGSSVAARTEIGDDVIIAELAGSYGRLIVEGAHTLFAYSDFICTVRGEVELLDTAQIICAGITQLSGTATVSGKQWLADGFFNEGLLVASGSTTIAATAPTDSPITGAAFDMIGSPDYAMGNLGTLLVEAGATLTLDQTIAAYPPANLKRAASEGITAGVGVVEMRGGALNLPKGLANYGVLKATAGENIIDGAVTNWEASGDAGVILIDGDGVSVTFTDPVDNDGKIICAPGTRTTFAQGVTGTGTVYRLEGCPKAVILGVDEGAIEVLGESLDNDEGATA